MKIIHYRNTECQIYQIICKLIKSAKIVIQFEAIVTKKVRPTGLIVESCLAILT